MNETKQGKCQNCKENDQELYPVRVKGKRQYWCDACIDGVKIHLTEKRLDKS